MAGDPYVLAVDIGTTSTKAVGVRVDGGVIAVEHNAYPLHTPAPGRAEQDPDEILDAVTRGARAVRAAAGTPLAVGFSAAMHSLIAVDARGQALTPCLTWADRRAVAQAERLHRDGSARDLHARTGLPVHALSPLCKIMWLRENDPRTFERSARFVSIKEFVLAALCGARVVDRSVAGATGMFDLRAESWSPDALALAGLDAGRLSRPVPTTHVLDPGLEGAPVVIGATDGVLANLGLGATTPGVLAVSLGTSGAVRAVVDAVTTDARGRLFCFVLDRGRWVLGGAINNAGIVLRWLRELLAADDGGDAYARLLALAESRPRGADGLLFLPFLNGERFARWRPDSCGVLAGLTLRHGRADLVRAAVEGILLAIRAIVHEVEELVGTARELRVGGGFARSAFVRQLLADVTGRRVAMPATEQASALGAARLALEATGAEHRMPPVEPDREHEPEAAASASYDALARLAGDLYAGSEALLPRLAAQRRADM